MQHFKFKKMDKNIKKKYREAFENKKQKMGIVAIKNLTSDKIYVKASLNTEAWMNKAKFSLKSGQFDHLVLQTDWKNLGADKFEFILINELEESDDPFVDYKKELEKLAKETLEKLYQQQVSIY